MSKSLMLAALAGAGSLALATSSAGATTALDYNVVAFGNFTSSNTEVNGAVAVAGDASMSSFSVGNHLDAGYSGAGLVVGGNLSYFNGQVFQGDAVIGGSLTAAGFGAPNGSIIANASSLPFDFAAAYAELSGLSSSFAATASNGTISGNNFIGTDAALNVFDISASALASSSGLNFTLPEGSIAVINVSGSSFTANWPGSVTVNGATLTNSAADPASGLLFNFADASSLTINGSWAGNILAPDADATLASGAFLGSLYANNITSTTEFYIAPFQGYDDSTPDPAPGIPEPATWAMMLAGFGLIGMAMRRRQRHFGRQFLA